MSQESEIKEQIKNWIVHKNSHVKPEEINEQTPLMEQKILNSLQIVELILYLGKLKGSPVDMSKSQAGSFSSIDKIYETFLK